MRVVLGAILLVVGLGAGWAVSQAMQPAAPIEGEAQAEPADLVAMRAEMRRTEDERAVLEAQLAALVNENEILRNEQALMESVLDDAARAGERMADTSEPVTEPAPTAEADSEDRDRRRGGPSPEQMEEFRRAQEEQREAMRARLDEELIRMGDPNAVQNFQTLLQYREAEQDLRRQMREASTDAQRQNISDDLRATELAARQLLNSQQDSILRGVAASNGITDRAAQDKFVEATRAALANPFFSMEPMLTGGRGPRGSWGGPPR